MGLGSGKENRVDFMFLDRNRSYNVIFAITIA